jgi:hypothetical protein
MKAEFWILQTLGIRPTCDLTNEALFAFLFHLKKQHSEDQNRGWAHAVGLVQMFVVPPFSRDAGRWA